MLLNIAIACGNGKKEWVDSLSPVWNTYLSLELGLDTDLEDQVQELEKSNMIDTYNKVKATKLTARRNKSNQLIVEGMRELEKF